jgi:hypothetical protein
MPTINLWHLNFIYIYIYIWVLEIMDKIIGGCETLRNQEFYNFVFPDIIRMMKSKSMRLAGHVARMGRRGMHARFWRENHKERDH